MIPLDIFSPTKTRFFQYYDRCAIRLDADEMTSLRVRIAVDILGSPVSRSLNFKYPYSKEFFGYGQAFHINNLIEEWPINYTSQYVWDHWNQHATLAHQLADVFQKLAVFCKVSIDFQEFVLPQGDSGDGNDLPAIKLLMQRLTEGLTFESGLGNNDLNPGNDRVNSFNHPFDLVRFKFPFGTVFQVTIESWQAGATGAGSLPGNPTTEVPYDPENPNALPPLNTPGGRDPENPYGADPPESSPLDPTLDPDDFSNAPDPNIGRGYALRAVGNVQVLGLDTTPRFVDITSGCIGEPITVGFEPNPQGGFDAVSRGLDGTLIDIFFTADLLGEAILSVVRCDLP